MDNDTLERLARLGAQARLLEIEQEAASIRDFIGGGEAPARRRKKLSPAARAAVSARMKAYWAARRREAVEKEKAPTAKRKGLQK